MNIRFDFVYLLLLL